MHEATVTSEEGATPPEGRLPRATDQRPQDPGPPEARKSASVTATDDPARPHSTGVLGLAGLALLGIALRAWLLVSPRGYLNADEAHTSIQARELFRGHGWILVPGTPYGGNVEAWLDAPLAALLGLSGLRSKVEVIVLWLVAAVVLARSVRHLGRGPAAAAFGAMWVPSAALVLLSTLAYPGYSIGLLATCGVLAVARPLLDQPEPERKDRAMRRSVVSRSGALGLLAGLAVWQHPLYGWVCATAIVAVVWRQRRRLLAVVGPLLGGGVLALSPVIVTNLRHDLISLRFRGPETEPYPDRVRAWITDLFPRAIGAKWQVPGWVAGRLSQVVAVLVLVALVAVCLAVLRWSPASGKVAAIALLLGPVALTLLGNTAYTLDGRYAVMVLPAGALVVAHGVALLPVGWVGGLRVPTAVAAWSVLAVMLPFRQGIGALEGPDRDIDQLVAVLDAHQATAVRADYWVAYRVVVHTDERIAASPLDPVKFDRYEQRVRRADARADGADVLVLDTDQVAAYLAAAAPFDAFPLNGFAQYRAHGRVEVSQWTVFLPPPGASPIGGG